MKRNSFLALICIVCSVTASNVINPEDGNDGESVFPVQLRVYGGTRVVRGDDRPYMLGLIYGNSGVEVMSGEHFIKSGIIGGIGLASETRMGEPVYFGLDLNIQVGSSYFLGDVGLGLGYNHAVSENKLWVQGKAVLSWATAYKDMGRIPGFGGTGLFSPYLVVNGTNIYEPSIDVTTWYFMLRPEINGFFRLSKTVLGVVGAGYQLPFYSSDISFMFSGKDYSDESVSESIKSSSNNVQLYLDGERVKKTKLSPIGLIVNFGIAVEI